MDYRCVNLRKMVAELTPLSYQINNLIPTIGFTDVIPHDICQKLCKYNYFGYDLFCFVMHFLVFCFHLFCLVFCCMVLFGFCFFAFVLFSLCFLAFVPFSLCFFLAFVLFSLVLFCFHLFCFVFYYAI